MVKNTQYFHQPPWSWIRDLTDIQKGPGSNPSQFRIVTFAETCPVSNSGMGRDRKLSRRDKTRQDKSLEFKFKTRQDF